MNPSRPPLSDFSAYVFPHIIFTVAMAIMGGYLGLYFIYSIKSAMTKKTPEPAVTPAAIAGDAKPGFGMPSVDSPEFADYVDSPAFHKEIESNEYWAALGEK